MRGYHCFRCGVCRCPYQTFEEARACAMSDHTEAAQGVLWPTPLPEPTPRAWRAG